MFTRRLQKATVLFAVVISAITLISGVMGALQTGSSGFMSFGAAVASADSAVGSHVVAADFAPPAYSQPNVFVPGTGNPGETGAVYPGREHVVAYPAASPVWGDYASSVVAGGDNAAGVVRSLPPGLDATVGGYSQGGQAARHAALQPGVSADRPLTVVTTGDPCTEGSGILHRWPVAQAVTGVPCAPILPPARGTVINRADDPIASFPVELNGVTVANALAEYSYQHAHGYGPVDLTQTNVRSYTVGNVTYVTIPRDKTPALVRWARDRGLYVAPELQQWIADVTVRPDPGPAGALPPAPEPAAAAPVAAEIAPPPPPVLPVMEAMAPMVPRAPPPPLAAPSGNVEIAAELARAVLPPEATPLIDQVAVQVQNSPLGGFINGLPPLG